jgi:hypothetical protein
MRRTALALLVCSIALVPRLSSQTAPPAANESKGTRFEISCSSSLHSAEITGRVLLRITRDKDKWDVAQGGSLLFGVDAEHLKPGALAIVDEDALGYPLSSLKDIPPGDYFVQAFLNVYTEFHRSDGHTIWAHMDQWEGQNFKRSPGNLLSEVQKIHLNTGAGYSVRLNLTKQIPPIEMPPDTQWVKRIKIQSKLLTQFWGHPFFLGATILLPKGYEEHPNSYYPVIYAQGHFSLAAPLGFSTDPKLTHGCKPESVRQGRKLNVRDPAEDCDDSGSELTRPESGFEFYQSWTSENFPRMIVVTFQHPTPYYDDSYAVNSANAGPYGDAIMTELIPYVERKFRVIAEPYARVLTGASTGGWESLALQIYHPEFFGGSWAVAPDPVDFRRYELINIYSDDNAFTAPGNEWSRAERYDSRTPDGQPRVSVRNFSRMESVLGSKGRSGDDQDNWEAVYGPTDAEGYPKPLWDKRTGKIDHEVANYMKEHGYDLRAYLEKNWQKIGPQLVGKLHLICGDMDDYYLNGAVYLLEDFLESTKDPYYAGSFDWGRPMKAHGWMPTTEAELIRQMAKYIAEHAGPEDDPRLWNY